MNKKYEILEAMWKSSFETETPILLRICILVELDQQNLFFNQIQIGRNFGYRGEV